MGYSMLYCQFIRRHFEHKITYAGLQSRQWVDGSWVSGSNGLLFGRVVGYVGHLMGQCMLTHDPTIILIIPASHSKI